jgi:hypothetical protein
MSSGRGTIPCFRLVSGRTHRRQYTDVILGHGSWILVPVPCAAHIAGGVDGPGGESELTKSFQLVETTESSANDQCINVVGSHVANRVM